MNENDSLSLKKQKPIKTIALKNASKLNTEVKDTDTDLLSHAQRLAANRLFAHGRKEITQSLSKP